MDLTPTLPELLARARGDLRMGLPVLLGGAMILAVETLTPARLDAVRKVGEPVLTITGWRAATLKARAYDADVARVVVPAHAGVSWLRALADPVDDLRVPMKGPLATLREGDAAVHRAALVLCKAAFLLPAAIVVAAPVGLGTDHALTVLPMTAMSSAASPLYPVVSAHVPLVASAAGRVHVFRPEDGGEEHYAIEIGRPDRNASVLARLHSACFTGDVLGSLKCDCGPQLRVALAQMGAAGAGVLLYLNQEGRGIGLANKMRAYALQDQGFDTVEANHRLGFEDDERDFRIGAALLRQMGFASVRLMTNNPRKIAMMESCGVVVTERVPLHVGQTAQNEGYLATKAAKSGHML